MGKIKGIHHVALKVKPESYDKAVKFYTDILEMETVRSWGEAPYFACMISTGDNSTMEILANDGADSVNAGPLPHIAFETDFVDELTEKVRAAGYEITVEPKDVTLPASPPYPIRVAFCRGAGNEEIEFFKVY